MTDFIKKMQTVAAHLDAAKQVLDSGPLDYYFQKLVEHSDALLTKFAPIKTGELAKISKKVKCEGGWKGCEKTLAVGAIGEVTEVDYSNNKFYYEFVPNIQVYQTSDGKWLPTDNKYSYYLSEEYLERVG